jgi:hypothetical protein
MLALDQAAVPSRGGLVALSGYGLAVVMEPDQNGCSIKVVTVRKDGRREICHYLIEALYGPQEERLASLIRFYDACVEFHDGSANGNVESEIESLIARARPEAFELLRTAATAIREFDSPTNYSRARVLLDYAMRTDADDIEIEECRAALNAVKEASRAQLDLARYYKKMREAGYEPTVNGFGGGVAIGFSVSRGERPVEADEVEDMDVDFDLRRDYARSVWEARPASDLPARFQRVPLGI